MVARRRATRLLALRLPTLTSEHTGFLSVLWAHNISPQGLCTCCSLLALSSEVLHISFLWSPNVGMETIHVFVGSLTDVSVSLQLSDCRDHAWFGHHCVPRTASVLRLQIHVSGMNEAWQKQNPGWLTQASYCRQGTKLLTGYRKNVWREKPYKYQYWFFSEPDDSKWLLFFSVNFAFSQFFKTISM